MLTVQDSQGLALKAAIKTFVELRMPTTHMKGFFKKELYDTTAIPLEIMRDNDYAAVDVVRGTNGNMNQNSVWTAKTIIPPFYHEKFNMNTLRSYERVFGQDATNANSASRTAFAKEAAVELVKLNNKIVRAEELQCSQALETGIVVLKSAESINYKRRSESLVDGATSGEFGYWTDPNCKVDKQLIKGCEFIREQGANNSGVMNITMSGQAFVALQETNYFKKIADWRNVTLASIGNPVGRAGASFHGQIVAGAFILNVWTYDGTYTNDSGVRTRLTDEYKIIITPVEGAQFELAYGAVDSIVKSSGATSVSGIELAKAATDYYVWDNVDMNNLNRIMHMTSAPVARLITVDMVYTLKVAADWSEIVAE